jgi:hypothetical protein
MDQGSVKPRIGQLLSKRLLHFPLRLNWDLTILGRTTPQSWMQNQKGKPNQNQSSHHIAPIRQTSCFQDSKKDPPILGFIAD